MHFGTGQLIVRHALEVSAFTRFTYDKIHLLNPSFKIYTLGLSKMLYFKFQDLRNSLVVRMHKILMDTCVLE